MLPRPSIVLSTWDPNSPALGKIGEVLVLLFRRLCCQFAEIHSPTGFGEANPSNRFLNAPFCRRLRSVVNEIVIFGASWLIPKHWA